jgi:hypothetical protein
VEAELLEAGRGEGKAARVDVEGSIKDRSWRGRCRGGCEGACRDWGLIVERTALRPGVSTAEARRRLLTAVGCNDLDGSRPFDGKF